MAASEAAPPQPRRRRHPIDGVATFIQTTATNLFPFPKSPPPSPPPRILRPIIVPQQILSLSSSESTRPDSVSSSGSFALPSTVKISRLNTIGGKGGPAFVGQVYSMCDLSGTGLMAVTRYFDIPFISKRTPEWIKKIFATVGGSERKGPVFRIFMDLGDAVSYVRRMNIPSGIVGACRLDLAYENYKEKPHLFKFIPNEKQVKEANKLLKTMHQNGGNKKVDGVPVFSAQNLDIAIATTDGVKWYTPYFFDKKMLDNILEDSVDQHFNSMIQTRSNIRRKDATDDSMPSEMSQEAGESTWEPPEVQEVLDEVGMSEVPMDIMTNTITKVAKIQLLNTVDKVLLGNRWLRKATGIQPKFPYMVESFERRSAASLLRASESSRSLADFESDHQKHIRNHNPLEVATDLSLPSEQGQGPIFQFPFGNWFQNPWSKQLQNQYSPSDTRVDDTSSQEHLSSPFLPKITMVGISSGEVARLSKAQLKKTMKDLTRELQEADQGNDATNTESKFVERDPLFVSNVEDYHSSAAEGASTRFVRRGIN